MQTLNAIPAPPPPAPGQTLGEYGTALLYYVIEHGTARLDADQLRWADHAAQAYATTVRHGDPEETEAGKLEPHQYQILEQFNAARSAIAAAQGARRRQWAEVCAAIEQAGQSQPSAQELGAQADDEPRESDEDRAIKLLRAALALILGPPQPGQGGGGRKAPLIPPSPTRPPGSPALDPRRPNAGNLPPKDGIQF